MALLGVVESFYTQPTNGAATVPFNELGHVMLDVSQIVEVELELIHIVPVRPAWFFRR